MKTDNYQISAPIGEIIDIINDHKPTGNIYDGYNSVEEQTDEKITNVLDDIIADIVNSYPERTVNDILNLNSEYHGCVLNAAIRSAMNESSCVSPFFIINYAQACLPFISNATLLAFKHDCKELQLKHFEVYNGDMWESFYYNVVIEINNRGLK